MKKSLELTPDVAENIIQKLVNGKPLVQICQDPKSPSLSTIYKWMKKNPDFAKQLTEARKIAAWSYVDQAIMDLDTASTKDIMIVREKVQMARWMASKLLPQFSDKQEIVSDQRIEIVWNTQDQNKEKIIEGEGQVVST